VSPLVAIAVNGEVYREVLGICDAAKEDKAGWSAFFKHLKERGLSGVRLIISDACLGLAESAAEFFPATLHRPLVPQHLQPRALRSDRGDAQGDPCGRGHRSKCCTPYG
jgi:transposase-like protein